MAKADHRNMSFDQPSLFFGPNLFFLLSFLRSLSHEQRPILAVRCYLDLIYLLELTLSKNTFAHRFTATLRLCYGVKPMANEAPKSNKETFGSDVEDGMALSPREHIRIVLLDPNPPSDQFSSPKTETNSKETPCLDLPQIQWSALSPGRSSSQQVRAVALDDIEHDHVQPEQRAKENEAEIKTPTQVDVPLIPWNEFLLEELAAGGFGKVFKALWHEQTVAIKLLHFNQMNLEQAKTALLREASFLRQVAHDSVIRWSWTTSL